MVEHITFKPRDSLESGPGFASCAFCSCPILIGLDEQHQEIALSPVLGNAHLCGVNCACLKKEHR